MTLADATGWLGRVSEVGDTDRDSLVISNLLASVEHEVDDVCGTVFMPTSSLDMEVEIFSRARLLQIPRAQSVDSITFEGEVLSGWSKGHKTDPTDDDPGFTRIRYDDGCRWDPGVYVVNGTFGFAAPPEIIKQAIRELLEFRYNTRQGVANITGFGDVVMEGGRPYPASVFAVLRRYRQLGQFAAVI